MACSATGCARSDGAVRRLPQSQSGKPAERLNPALQVEGRKLYLLTPELAGVPHKILGERVANLAAERRAIIEALDLLFTGI